jgi:GDP-L-fucose synthase
MEKHSKVYIAGHGGMVGSAVYRRLLKEGFTNIVTRSSKELDLRDQQQVTAFFAAEKPDYVFLAAARVGGIIANNTYRGEFLYENLMIQSNIIHQSYLQGVKKLLFLGSSCIYPKLAPQPLKEEYLLTGPLEYSNEPYAIAKIAGLKMCEAYRAQYGCNYITVMPTNLYGPNDNYDLTTSHVLPALLRKFHEAKENGSPSVMLWGTGTPHREFMHADDLADALLFLMNNYDKAEPVNIGVGHDISIKNLALLIQQITGFTGTIEWDTTKPDGTPKKLMDVTRINTAGWKASVSLQQGIEQVYKDTFLKVKAV